MTIGKANDNVQLIQENFLYRYHSMAAPILWTASTLDGSIEKSIYGHHKRALSKLEFTLLELGMQLILH